MAAVRGQVVPITASSVKSASGNSGVVRIPNPDSAVFYLIVTASSAPTSLDVYLQHSLDAGATWIDFAHFTQVGVATTAFQALQWTRKQTDGTAGTDVIGAGDGVLAAAKVINGPIIANYFRAKWVITGTSYTFSMSAVIDRD